MASADYRMQSSPTSWKDRINAWRQKFSPSKRVGTTSTATKPGWYTGSSFQLVFMLLCVALVIVAVAVASVALTRIHTKRWYDVESITNEDANGGNGKEYHVTHQIPDPGQNGIVDLEHPGVLFQSSCNVVLPTPTANELGHIYTIVASEINNPVCVTGTDNYMSIRFQNSTGTQGATLLPDHGETAPTVPTGGDGLYWMLNIGDGVTSLTTPSSVTFTAMAKYGTAAGVANSGKTVTQYFWKVLHSNGMQQTTTGPPATFYIASTPV